MTTLAVVVLLLFSSPAWATCSGCGSTPGTTGGGTGSVGGSTSAGVSGGGSDGGGAPVSTLGYGSSQERALLDTATCQAATGNTVIVTAVKFDGSFSWGTFGPAGHSAGFMRCLRAMGYRFGDGPHFDLSRPSFEVQR